MEKNCILDHSITHSPSLFDAPGTKAFASEWSLVSDELQLNKFLVFLAGTVKSRMPMSAMYLHSRGYIIMRRHISYTCTMCRVINILCTPVVRPRWLLSGGVSNHSFSCDVLTQSVSDDSVVLLCSLLCIMLDFEHVLFIIKCLAVLGLMTL